MHGEGKEVPQKTPFKSQYCKEVVRESTIIISQVLGLENYVWVDDTILVLLEVISSSHDSLGIKCN